MKKVLRHSILLILAGFMILGACKKEYSCEGCNDNKNNKPPMSVAGPDRVITLPTDSVLLDGSSSSDPDGMISSYLWTKISGPASFNILKPSDSITKLKTLVTGTYQFELKVTDNGGLSAKDTMRIIVDPVLTLNHPPIANAGADQTITLPTNAVNLDGSGSTDPENNITAYAWTKISGPNSFNIVNSSAVQTQVTTLIQGTYQFELKVTDALGLFSKDTMQVIVNAALSNNLPPVAIGGNDTTIQTNQTSCTPVPITITLNGNNSYDPDGSISNYLWIGPNGIANPNSAITTINGIFQGTISIILKVTDNNGAVGYDTIRISIIPANRPLIPAQLIPIGTLSQTRWGVSVAAAGDKILFAGGSPDGCAVTTVDIYDIATGTWTTSQISQARIGMGVASVGNKIFFAGGIVPLPGPPGPTCYTTNMVDTRTSVVDIYDVSTNSWSTSQLSAPRHVTGTAINNKAVFAGGDAIFFQPNDRADIYSAGTNIWSIASLSMARELDQPATSADKIYFTGGSADFYGVSGGIAYDRIDIYNTISNSWSFVSLMRERTKMGNIVANNKLYSGGGWIWDLTSNNWEKTNSVEIRDLSTNTITFDCLSEPKAEVNAFRKDNKIVFINVSDYIITSNNKFDILDLTSNSWSIGVLPQTISFTSIISYNNIIYATDGNHVWKLEF